MIVADPLSAFAPSQGFWQFWQFWHGASINLSAKPSLPRVPLARARRKEKEKSLHIPMEEKRGSERRLDPLPKLPKAPKGRFRHQYAHAREEAIHGAG